MIPADKMDINKQSPLLSKDEGIDYMSRLLSIMPKCSLWKEINNNVQFLKGLNYSMIVVPINPFNGFPSLGTIIGDSNSEKKILRDEIISPKGLETLLKGGMKIDNIERAFDDGGAENYDESLLTVTDKTSGYEFKFWGKGIDGFKTDTLFIHSKNEGSYKFAGSSDLENDIKSMAGGLQTLHELTNQSIVVPFLDYCYVNGIVKTTRDFDDVATYMAMSLDFARLINEDKKEYISPQFVRKLIEQRKKAQESSSVFFQIAQSEEVVEAIKKYSAKEN